MLAGEVVKTAANGLLILVLTNFLLTPTQYGQLFLVLSIEGVLRSIGGLGIASSTARYLTDYRSESSNTESQVPHILRFGSAIRLTTAIVTGVSLALASGLLSSYFGGGIATLLIISGMYLVASSCYAFLKSIFQGFNRVEWSAAVTGTDNAARLLFAVLFVVAFDAGAEGALAGYVAGATLATLLGATVLYTKFYTTLNPAKAMETGLRRRILEYSVPIAFSESANVIDKRIDTVLVGFFISPVAVGFYTLAKQISEFIIVPAGSLGFAISPVYGEEKATGNLNQAARAYEATLRYTLLLYVPAAVGLVLVAEPAIRLLFGAQYVGAVPVVKAFSVFIVFQAIVAITTQSLDYLGRARSRAYVKGGTSIANAGLNVVLIPAFGVLGAVYATIITFGIYTVALLYITASELDLRVDRLVRDGLVIGAIATVMGAAVYATGQWLSISGPFTLGGTVALGGMLWAVMSIGSGMVNPQQIRALL